MEINYEGQKKWKRGKSILKIICGSSAKSNLEKKLSLSKMRAYTIIFPKLEKFNWYKPQRTATQQGFSSVQSLSHVQLFVTPWIAAHQASVHHQLPEFTQTHVHRVGDAIQPLHPLSSPCPPALNLSQNQGLFQWVSSSHHVAKVLEFQLQYQSFQWTLRTDLL